MKRVFSFIVEKIYSHFKVVSLDLSVITLSVHFILDVYWFLSFFDCSQYYKYKLQTTTHKVKKFSLHLQSSDLRKFVSIFLSYQYFFKKQWPSTRLLWSDMVKVNGTKRTYFVDGMMLH